MSQVLFTCVVCLHAAGQEVAFGEWIAQPRLVFAFERSRLNDVNVEGSVVVVVRQLQLDVAPHVRRLVVLKTRHSHIISTGQQA